MKEGKAPKVPKKKIKEARDKAKAIDRATREASKTHAIKAIKDRGGDDDDDEDDEDADQEDDQEDDDEDQEYDDEYGDYGDEDNAVIAEDKPPKATTTKAAKPQTAPVAANQVDEDEEIKATDENETVGEENENENEEEVEDVAVDFTAKPPAFAQSNQTQKQKDDDV